MKHGPYRLFLMITAALMTLMFFSIRASTFAGEQAYQSSSQEVAKQLAQAAHYRQEAEELQQTIERYRIMRDIYAKGSQERIHGFNRLGRQRMVERLERVLQHFT